MLGFVFPEDALGLLCFWIVPCEQEVHSLKWLPPKAASGSLYEIYNNLMLLISARSKPSHGRNESTFYLDRSAYYII